MTLRTCFSCHESDIICADCPTCARPCCALCWMVEGCCIDCAPARRAGDDIAALRWYERRGALGEAPAPAMRAELMQRGLVCFGPNGIELTSAGRAVLAGLRDAEAGEPLCATSGALASECDHLESAEFDLGGEA